MTLTLGMITIDCADPKRLAQFWTAAMDMKVAWSVDDEYTLLTPSEAEVPAGGEFTAPPRPNLGLQKVPEPRNGKNRVHIDFGTEDRAAEVKRLLELGATEVDEQVVPGFAWTVLADPEGNVFCVGQPQEE